MPRTQRLQQRTDFLRIYREGVRVVGRYVVVFAQTGSTSETRLGVTASKKVGSSVIRNRCKRRIRELFRLNRDRLPEYRIDMVVNARRGCADASWETVWHDYMGCLNRLKKALGEQNRQQTAETKG